LMGEGREGGGQTVPFRHPHPDNRTSLAGVWRDK